MINLIFFCSSLLLPCMFLLNVPALLEDCVRHHVQVSSQQQSKSVPTLYFSSGPLWWKITSDFRETSDFVDRKFIFVEISIVYTEKYLYKLLETTISQSYVLTHQEKLLVTSQYNKAGCTLSQHHSKLLPSH